MQVIYKPPDVTTSSSREAKILAKHLRAKGAKFYGTYWCGNCFEQKQTFGKEAAKLLNYVECAEDGLNTERPTCRANQVRGYPTWEIDGELFPGLKDIDDLAVLSGCCDLRPGFCGGMSPAEVSQLAKEAFRR